MAQRKPPKALARKDFGRHDGSASDWDLVTKLDHLTKKFTLAAMGRARGALTRPKVRQFLASEGPWDWHNPCTLGGECPRAFASCNPARGCLLGGWLFTFIRASYPRARGSHLNCCPCCCTPRTTCTEPYPPQPAFPAAMALRLLRTSWLCPRAHRTASP